ncbi:MAG: alanine dehydrogenase [Lachnospirales bacterium]
MRIGVPKEIKNNEGRVSMSPASVNEYVVNGHEVFVEKSAGIKAGFTDEEYVAVGAKIVDTAKEAWDNEMVVKVKEPLKEEYQYFKKDLILYTYLHLAAEPELTNALLEKEVLGIAYETVELNGRLPLLRPMSEMAGRRATTVGVQFLESHNGGQGILIGGAPGVDRGVVTIIGDGVSAINAAKMAIGLGAKVYMLALHEDRIRYLDEIFDKELTVIKSNESNIAKYTEMADILISTVLIPGEKAPKIVKEYMVKTMKKGSVIVDISIDQGGSVETIDRITTHDNPVFEKHGVLHYSVANMPGAVPRTATVALTNATTQFGVIIANRGFDVIRENNPVRTGVNTYKGHLTNEAVANSLDITYKNILELL